MKHLILLFSFFAITLLIVGCGSKTQKTSTNIDTVKTDDVSSKDKTIYGICGEGTAMNTLQVITDNSDTLEISIADAKDNGMVLGGFECGDRLAVMAKKEGKEYIASEVINLNTLLGSWIMPNPIDGSDFVGIKLKDGGIAESINNNSTFYKTWRIFNGKIILTANRDGGGDEE
ncbi:MAG TPA: lipocalin family protein, partial [Xylanibacter oryzae]|nr:lipocalin family protein [Xylanibacter oryzae]